MRPKMLRALHIIFFSTILISCNTKNEKKIDQNVNSDIHKKYIQYLNDYYPSGEGSNGEKVEIKRIAEKTFWVTFTHGAGTKQEIYWLLDKNCLISTFEFEYGGMNWESELNYTFKNINNNETITGDVYGIDSENQIALLKEKFINKFK